MAYYCTKCKQYHYPSSEVGKSHKIYASKKHKPKETVERKTETKAPKKRKGFLGLFKSK